MRIRFFHKVLLLPRPVSNLSKHGHNTGVNTSAAPNDNNKSSKKSFDTTNNKKNKEKGSQFYIKTFIAGGGAGLLYKFYEDHKKYITSNLPVLEEKANELINQLDILIDKTEILTINTRNELQSKKQEDVQKQKQELELIKQKIDNLIKTNINLFYLSPKRIPIGVYKQANSLSYRLNFAQAKALTILEIIEQQEQYLCKNYTYLQQQIEQMLIGTDENKLLPFNKKLKFTADKEDELASNFLSETSCVKWNLYALSAWANKNYIIALKCYQNAQAVANNPKQEAIIKTNVIRTLLKLVGIETNLDKKKKLFDKIIQLCSDAIKAIPTNPEISLCYGIALALQGNDECTDFFNKALIKSKQDNITALSYLAQYLINANRNNEAIERIKDIYLESKNIKHGPLFYNRAIARFNLGQIDDALIDMKYAKMLLKGENRDRDEHISNQYELMSSSGTKPKLKSELYEWTLTEKSKDKSNHVANPEELQSIFDSFDNFYNCVKSAQSSSNAAIPRR